jgi:AcrR family transcriptional regulator
VTPREQILSTATRLFFTQGYSRTGINQLIDESAVAKRTFYHHFESKEALGEAYLELASRGWLAGLAEAAAGKRTPGGVARALFEHVERFAVETTFRGCGILNMAAEFADAGGAVRTRVREHKDAQRALVRALFAAVGGSAAAADAVDVLIEGAIAGAAAHLDVWPVRTAAHTAERLLAADAAHRKSEE